MAILKAPPYSPTLADPFPEGTPEQWDRINAILEQELIYKSATTYTWCHVCDKQRAKQKESDGERIWIRCLWCSNKVLVKGPPFDEIIPEGE